MQEQLRNIYGQGGYSFPLYATQENASQDPFKRKLLPRRREGSELSSWTPTIRQGQNPLRKGSWV